MIYTIPDSQRSVEASISDLAWRGISWPVEAERLLDQLAGEEAPIPQPVALELCGAAKSQETELQRFFNAKI